MRKTPTVSVIIPTYNRAHLIGRAIQSVLNQTYQDFEIIIVDDASIDNTEEVVKSFSNKRIRYIRLKENSGGSAAPRNTAIKIARGEYIAFQDSDDEWLPEKLEKQIRVFEKVSPEVGIVYTDMWTVDKNGKKKYWHSPRRMPEDGIIYREVLGYRLMNIGISSAMIRGSCFDKVGLFDERMPRHQDLEFFIRLSKYYLFYHINEPLIKYFDIGERLSSNNKALITATELILEKHFEDIKKDRKLLSKHYYDIGNTLFQQGEMDHGRSYILQAIKTYPCNFKALVAAFISLFGPRIYKMVVKAKRLVLPSDIQ